MRVFVAALLAVALAANGQTPVPMQVSPQDDSAARAAVLAKVRGAWYHPGNVTLACAAAFDFSQVVAITGDAASGKVLAGLKVQVKTSPDKSAELTFEWPKEAPEADRGPLEAAVRQVVGGFFQAYWPIANGDIVPKIANNPTVTGAAGGGYVISAGGVGKGSRLTVDNSGLPRRLEDFSSGPKPAILTLNYEVPPSPKPGDLNRLSGITTDRAGENGLRVQANMTWDTVDIHGVFLPHRVSVTIPGAFTLPVTLTNCSVAPVVAK